MTKIFDPVAGCRFQEPDIQALESIDIIFKLSHNQTIEFLNPSHYTLTEHPSIMRSELKEKQLWYSNEIYLNNWSIFLWCNSSVESILHKHYMQPHFRLDAFISMILILIISLSIWSCKSTENEAMKIFLCTNWFLFHWNLGDTYSAISCTRQSS